MYKLHYFHGTERLKDIRAITNEQFNALGGKRSKANYYDSFKRLAGLTEDNVLLPVERAIQYRKYASLHTCNAKCLNGKETGICECQCGGKNHGLGSIQ
jgi:hypothetical protein